MIPAHPQEGAIGAHKPIVLRKQRGAAQAGLRKLARSGLTFAPSLAMTVQPLMQRPPHEGGGRRAQKVLCRSIDLKDSAAAIENERRLGEGGHLVSDGHRFGG